MVKRKTLVKRDLQQIGARVRPPDDKKLRELILYIAKKSQNDPHFGSTKLNKLLFFADFIAYGRLAKPISGHKYEKRENGPFLRGFFQIRDDMIRRKNCVEQEKERFGYTQKRLLALREPDLSTFSGAEIAIVEEVLESLEKLSARDISELAHGFIGWEACTLGEVIPYETIFISPRKLTEKEKEYGLKLEPTCVG